MKGRITTGFTLGASCLDVDVFDALPQNLDRFLRGHVRSVLTATYPLVIFITRLQALITRGSASYRRRL